MTPVRAVRAVCAQFAQSQSSVCAHPYRVRAHALAGWGPDDRRANWLAEENLHSATYCAILKVGAV
jgi:hypothetical protein